MTGIKELKTERSRLGEEIERIDEAIANDPDEIRASFSEDIRARAPEVLDRVSYIRAVSGLTDSRKNMMRWCGYRFRLRDDPNTYELRWGSNWCSDFCELSTNDDAVELRPDDVIQKDEPLISDVDGRSRSAAEIIAILLRWMDW